MGSRNRGSAQSGAHRAFAVGSLAAYNARMKPIVLEIPPEVADAARIPAGEMVQTLKQELAVHLYERQILPKAAARRLADLDRLAFDQLLGQRGIASRLEPADVDADLLSLRASQRSPKPNPGSEPAS
jgi:predicted HTH domain antitoxin